MKIIKLEEAGYMPAMLGLSLSHNQPVDNMPDVAERLHDKDGGHNKFMESIVVWLDITAPRFWWSEFDTYRVGVTKQSESTMHTLKDKFITREDFEYPICIREVDHLNDIIKFYSSVDPKVGGIERIKNDLPEGFLQRRIVCTNYKTLRNIINQRRNHKLPQWHIFIDAVLGMVDYPELLD